MAEKNSELTSLLKGSNYCVKCGSKVPYDEIGHKCEIIYCPGQKIKPESGK